MITPAIRARLQEVADNRLTRSGQGGYASYSVERVRSMQRPAPTYVMVGRLEKLGLIEWDPVQPTECDPYPRWRARLTNKGREALESPPERRIP